MGFDLCQTDIEHLDHLEDDVILEEVLVPFSHRPEGGAAAGVRQGTLPRPPPRPSTSSLGQILTGLVLVLMSMQCRGLGRSYQSVTAVAPFMVKIKMFATAVADLNFASHHLHVFYFFFNAEVERHPSSPDRC